MKLYERLDLERKEQNLSYKTLAIKTKLTYVTIYQTLNGKTRRMTTYEKIAKVLNFDIDIY